MPSKRVDHKHAVKANVHIHELTKAGTSIDFEVFADGEKLGTLIVGRGSITWFGKSRRNGLEMSWTRFAQLMAQDS